MNTRGREIESEMIQSEHGELVCTSLACLIGSSAFGFRVL